MMERKLLVKVGAMDTLHASRAGHYDIENWAARNTSELAFLKVGVKQQYDLWDYSCLSKLYKSQQGTPPYK